MTVSPLALEGANVFWDAEDVSMSNLRTALVSADLQQFMPEERTEQACLKAAISKYKDEILKEKDHLFAITARKVVAENGYHVFDVRQREDLNDAEPLFGAKVSEGNVVIDQGFASRDSLQNYYNVAKATATASMVGKVLIGVVKHFDGTTLREKGGLYWVPPGTVDEWEKAANSFEKWCNAKVNTMRNVVDEGTLRAVHRAINKEIEEAAKEMVEEIDSGDLKEHALKRRKAKAEDLHRRINMFSVILGEELTELHEHLKKPEQAAAEAIAQLEVDTFEGVI